MLQWTNSNPPFRAILSDTYYTIPVIFSDDTTNFQQRHLREVLQERLGSFITVEDLEVVISYDRPSKPELWLYILSFEYSGQEGTPVWQNSRRRPETVFSRLGSFFTRLKKIPEDSSQETQEDDEDDDDESASDISLLSQPPVVSHEETLNDGNNDTGTERSLASHSTMTDIEEELKDHANNNGSKSETSLEPQILEASNEEAPQDNSNDTGSDMSLASQPPAVVHEQNQDSQPLLSQIPPNCTGRKWHENETRLQSETNATTMSDEDLLSLMKPGSLVNRPVKTGSTLVNESLGLKDNRNNEADTSQPLLSQIPMNYPVSERSGDEVQQRLSTGVAQTSTYELLSLLEPKPGRILSAESNSGLTNGSSGPAASVQPPKQNNQVLEAQVQRKESSPADSNSRDKSLKSSIKPTVHETSPLNVAALPLSNLFHQHHQSKAVKNLTPNKKSTKSHSSSPVSIPLCSPSSKRRSPTRQQHSPTVIRSESTTPWREPLSTPFYSFSKLNQPESSEPKNTSSQPAPVRRVKEGSENPKIANNQNSVSPKIISQTSHLSEPQRQVESDGKISGSKSLHGIPRWMGSIVHGTDYIPRDQRKLLKRDDAWATELPGSSVSRANVPVRYLQTWNEEQRRKRDEQESYAKETDESGHAMATFPSHDEHDQSTSSSQSILKRPYLEDEKEGDVLTSSSIEYEWSPSPTPLRCPPDTPPRRPNTPTRDIPSSPAYVDRISNDEPESEVSEPHESPSKQDDETTMTHFSMSQNQDGLSSATRPVANSPKTSRTVVVESSALTRTGLEKRGLPSSQELTDTGRKLSIAAGLLIPSSYETPQISRAISVPVSQPRPRQLVSPPNFSSSQRSDLMDEFRSQRITRSFPGKVGSESSEESPGMTSSNTASQEGGIFLRKKASPGDSHAPRSKGLCSQESTQVSHPVVQQTSSARVPSSTRNFLESGPVTKGSQGLETFNLKMQQMSPKHSHESSKMTVFGDALNMDTRDSSPRIHQITPGKIRENQRPKEPASFKPQEGDSVQPTSSENAESTVPVEKDSAETSSASITRAPGGIPPYAGSKERLNSKLSPSGVGSLAVCSKPEKSVCDSEQALHAACNPKKDTQSKVSGGPGSMPDPATQAEVTENDRSASGPKTPKLTQSHRTDLLYYSQASLPTDPNLTVLSRSMGLSNTEPREESVIQAPCGHSGSCSSLPEIGNICMLTSVHEPQFPKSLNNGNDATSRVVGTKRKASDSGDKNGTKQPCVEEHMHSANLSDYPVSESDGDYGVKDKKADEENASDTKPTTTIRTRARKKTRLVDENTPPHQSAVEALHMSFKETYPIYNGSIDEFVQACHKLNSCRMHGRKYRTTQLWDDFIHRFVSEYRSYQILCKSRRRQWAPYEDWMRRVTFPLMKKRRMTPADLDMVVAETSNFVVPGDESGPLSNTTSSLMTTGCEKKTQVDGQPVLDDDLQTLSSEREDDRGMTRKRPQSELPEPRYEEGMDGGEDSDLEASAADLTSGDGIFSDLELLPPHKTGRKGSIGEPSEAGRLDEVEGDKHWLVNKPLVDMMSGTPAEQGEGCTSCADEVCQSITASLEQPFEESQGRHDQRAPSPPAAENFIQPDDSHDHDMSDEAGDDDHYKFHERASVELGSDTSWQAQADAVSETDAWGVSGDTATGPQPQPPQSPPPLRQRSSYNQSATDTEKPHHVKIRDTAGGDRNVSASIISAKLCAGTAPAASAVTTVEASPSWSQPGAASSKCGESGWLWRPPEGTEGVGVGDEGGGRFEVVRLVSVPDNRRRNFFGLNAGRN